MRLLLVSLLLFFSVKQAVAQSWEKIDYSAGNANEVSQVEALLRTPEGAANRQAVLLLHHAGGFSFNTTRQYAEFLSQRGFLTLELKMFNSHTDRPSTRILHGQVMGALKFLAARPDIDPSKISAMGMSLGAYLAMAAASSWFYEEFKGGDLRFNRLIAVYPICWFMSEGLKGQTQGINLFSDLPSNFLQKWEGVPLLMLVGGKDDYDGGKGEPCPAFIRQLTDERQAKVTQLQMYPTATHGWDHGKTYSFPVRGACLARSNCMNRNVFSPEIVEQGKKDALNFLMAP